jgi:hypothetical protein
VSNEYQPDLTGAEIYVEASDRPIAGGRWYVLPDDTVAYQPPDGPLRPASTPAATLRSDTTGWKRLPAEES